MGRLVSPTIIGLDDMMGLNFSHYMMGRWDDKDKAEYFGVNSHNKPQDCMTTEKAVSDIELKKSVQGMTVRQSSFMRHITRGEYTLKTLAYVVHHRGVELDELVEGTSTIYMGNMYPMG